jgi:hypothetical protein
MKKLQRIYSISLFFIILLASHICWGAPSKNKDSSVSPSIQSLSPEACPEGFIDVTISGNNFVGIQKITCYNGNSNDIAGFAELIASTKTTIKAKIKLNSNKYFFTVTTNKGTSNKSPILTVEQSGPEILPTLDFKMNLSAPQGGLQYLQIDASLDFAIDWPIQVSYQAAGMNSGQLDAGTLVIEPGLKQKSFPLNVTNAELYSMNENVEISLSEPVNVILGADRNLLVHVKDSRFGALGDGVTNDTAAIQQAVNLVHASRGDDRGTILFPPGTYSIISVNLRESITYLGDAAIMKRPDNIVDILGEVGAKWNRMWTFERWDYHYASDVDSLLTEFRGLTFDGNVQNQSYTGEQMHSLFLMARNTNPGRLKTLVEDCFFKNSPADGISIYHNTDILVNRVRGEDNKRGSLTLLGGYTKLRLTNTSFGGTLFPRALDFEVDGPGYGGTYVVDVYIDDLVLENGGYDCGLRPGCTLYGRNIRVLKPFVYFYNHGAQQVYEDCLFTLGVPYLNGVNAIVKPGNIQFTRCTFMANRSQDTNYNYSASPYIQWNISGTSERDQMVRFTDCRFEADESFLPTDEIWGILTGADLTTFNNWIVVEGGEISPRMNYGIRVNFYGHNWRVSRLRNYAKIPYRTHGIYTTDSAGNVWPYCYNVHLEDMETPATAEKFIYIGGHNVTDNKLTFKNLTVNEAQNYIYVGGHLSNVTIDSQRTILSENAPTSASHGFVGDVWQRSNGEKWRCTKIGYAYPWGTEVRHIPSEWVKIE